MADVVGRDTELAAGESFLGRVAMGPAALLIEGQAGIGKSTIWAEIARRAAARHALVLTARPAAAEADLTLSGLADLLGSLASTAFDQLPAPQRRALDAALLRSEATGPASEGRVLGTALRSLLAGLAAERPVVIAIDDLQWIDPASATTIGYAIRRLGEARIGILAARRTGEATPVGLAPIADLEGAVRLPVRPMTLAALHQVLKAARNRVPSRPALVRIHRTSGGNPFFALEIARLLDDLGEPSPGEPLPVPATVRDVLRSRMSRLPAPTREALLVVAATADARPEVIDAALERDTGPDLDLAVDEGIARRDGELVAFQHPLFQAAVYGGASPGQRRTVHGRLARALAGTEEGARHAALAATGPDPEVAAALEAAAIRADARAAPSAGAGLMELALRMTPTDADADRDRRTLDLATFVQRSGDAKRADDLLAGIVDSSASATVRVKARLKLAAIRFDSDAGRTYIELCEAALREDIVDPQLIAAAHATLAAVSWDDFRRRAEHAPLAVGLLEGIPDPDPLVLTLALSVKAAVDAEVSGGPLDPAVVERLLALEQVAATPSVADRFSAALGTTLKYQGDLVAARPWLEQTLQSAIDEGDEFSVAYALGHLPQLELWTGHWPEAEAYARRHIAVSEDLGLEAQRRQGLYNLAIILVHQGGEAEARALIGEALEAAAGDADAWTEGLVLPALGLLELSLGNHAAAVAANERASRIRDDIGDDRPRRHDTDIVESLVALGDLEAAALQLDAGQARASRRGVHSALANMARARAVLVAARDGTDAALPAIDEALAEHDKGEIPFDRARTMLVLGQIRRRRRERRAAQEALSAALAIFDGLGARLWSDRTRAELDRLGLRRSVGGGLTEGERRVAELAATGMTNRQVADALFLSPKTVEAHLARAYGKLGITSRAELGAVVAKGQADPSTS